LLDPYLGEEEVVLGDLSTFCSDLAVRAAQQLGPDR
jgi:hypothetical protein